MPLIETGGAAIAAIKAASDIIRDIRSSRDATLLKAAVNDLTAHLSDALSAVLDLQIQLAALKDALREAQAANGKQGQFAEKAQRYVRHQSRGGAIVYLEKDLGEGNGPSPEFCSHCFENEKISVLQPVGMMGISKCPTCGAATKTGR